MSSSQRPPNSIVGLDEISRSAVAHSLLTEGDIARILHSLGESTGDITARDFARQAVKLGKLTLFQARHLLSPQASLLSLGPYLILDKVGQGGMGAVYKARHKSMGRVVALKTLRKRAGFSEESILRFKREVVAAARLIHPNIVTAFDAGDQNGIHYLVMEYVAGGDLKSILDKDGPFSVSKAVQYVLQAAQGMQYAHDKGVIHRDIKPANLLLDTEGVVKILDLGLARFVHDRGETELQEEGLTADGALMGTVDFLSPEQSLDTKTADVRSDIYSLGCTLFTLLTGRPVFVTGSLVQKILAHREADVPSLCSIRPDISETLDHLFRRMLAKSPADRPQSMLEVANSLQRILAELDTTEIQRQSGSSIESEQRSSLSKNSDEVDTVKERRSQVTIGGISSDSVRFESFPEIRPREPLRQANSVKGARVNAWRLCIGLLVVVASLLGIGFFWFPSTPESKITLRFDPNEVGAIAGAMVWINQQERGPILGGVVQQFELDGRLDKYEVQIRKPGYEDFSRTITIPASGTAELPVSLLKRVNRELPGTMPSASTIPAGITSEPRAESLAVDSDPEPGKLDSVVTVANGDLSSIVDQEAIGDLGRSIPEDYSAPQIDSPVTDADEPPGNRIIIVGVGAGELPDLDKALEQAQPNDTILIRHRGPLSFSATDLNGKTPLTIMGGEQAGVDYWPIIRQKILPPETLREGQNSKRSIFSGDEVELHFKKLHLACGGYQREGISSLVECNSGVISFENCTVTASTDDAARYAEGEALPLVKLTGTASQHLDIKFTGSLVRGARLKSLVSVSAEASVTVSGDQFLWAGGQGPFIELGHSGSRATLRLKDSTIYNFASLLDVSKDRLNEKATDRLFDINLESTILVSKAIGSSSLVELHEEQREALTISEWKKLVNFSCINSVAANLDSWLPTASSGLGLGDISRLYEIDKTALVDSVPRFRVFPAGVELQEVEARDLEHLVTQRNQRPNDNVERQGIRSTEIPYALSRISERPVSDAMEAKQPRGIPNVIEVSKKNGPIRTLEEAFKQIQGEDVHIVITDSETYVPGRNYDLDYRTGVLFSEAIPHLTIRAADGEVPTIVMSDSPSVQSGNLPRIGHWNGEESQLFLISVRAQSLRIQGIHFTANISQGTKHAIFLTTANHIRMTNCRIIDRSIASQAALHFYNGYGIAHTVSGPAVGAESGEAGAAIAWIENVVVDHSMPPVQLIPQHFVTLPSAFSFVNGSMASKHLVFRNCAVGTNQFLFFNQGGVPWIDIEHCSLWGRLVGTHSEIKSINVVENIVFCATNPVITSPAGLIDSTDVRGSNNAVWIGNAPVALDERNQGPLGWMPGPVLSKPPVLDQNLQPKSRQPVASMAADGGPVGFKSERFPEWFHTRGK